MSLLTGIRATVIALMAFGTVAWHTESMALPILGANVIVNTTGNVTATYLGHTARISNDLYLDSPSNGMGLIFNNHTTPVGTTFDLGTFTAGTELLFRLYAHESGLRDLTAEGVLHGRGESQSGWYYPCVRGWPVRIEYHLCRFRRCLRWWGSGLRRSQIFLHEHQGGNPSGARNILAIGNRSWGNGFDEKTAQNKRWVKSFERFGFGLYNRSLQPSRLVRPLLYP